ncbi:hypothetical protein DRO57_05535 [Candidatus Bathyarchaeota archaeon]|nr:MAG: hypothetical protein DRO57_05535 [Candidatus Bathyarchaeota archaeon]
MFHHAWAALSSTGGFIGVYIYSGDHLYFLAYDDMLDLLNKIFIWLQRWVQGIPSGPAHLYDRLATRYLEPSYEHIVEELRDKTSGESLIVEVGCGTGKLLLKIAETLKPMSVMGIDISRAMIELSKRNLSRSRSRGLVDLILADAHNMPIRNQCVDLILSTGTLHHIRQPKRFFDECARVLKEDGEAWIYEFSHDAKYEDLRAIKTPRIFLKILAALHGIPRRIFEKGYIKKALEKGGYRYKISYQGAVTKLILGKT